jgi:hypothetical protein
VEVAEFGAGVDSYLGGEDAVDFAVRREGVGAAAGAEEGYG